jgi:hypothetical protein
MSVIIHQIDHHSHWIPPCQVRSTTGTGVSNLLGNRQLLVHRRVADSADNASSEPCLRERFRGIEHSWTLNRGYHLSIIFWLLGSTTPINRPWFINPGLTLNDLEMMLAICSDLKHNMFQPILAGFTWFKPTICRALVGHGLFIQPSVTRRGVVILHKTNCRYPSVTFECPETRQFCAAKDLSSSLIRCIICK